MEHGSFDDYYGGTMKYTIPKKQRDITGKGFELREVGLESRELQYLKHDVDRYRHKQAENEQVFGDMNILRVYMVENLNLEEDYAAKKSSLKFSGRTCKELDEHLVFLGRSKREAMKTICEQGVVAEPETTNAFLGDPAMGIYLWRHPDLCLDSLTLNMTGNAFYLIICRLIRGRVKSVVPRTNKCNLLEPTPNYDCHIPRLYKTGQQVNNLATSQIYVFDYDEEDALPRSRPRQCLPFAVIEFDKSYCGLGDNTTSITTSEKKSPLDKGMLTSVSHVVWNGFMCNKEIKDIGSIRLLSGHRFSVPLNFLMNLTKKIKFEEVMKFLPGDICDAWNLTVSFRHLNFDAFLVEPIECRSAINIQKLAKGLARKIHSFGVVVCDVSSRIYLLPSSDLAIHLGFCKSVEPWKLFGILLNDKRLISSLQTQPNVSENPTTKVSTKYPECHIQHDTINFNECFNTALYSRLLGFHYLSYFSNSLNTDEPKIQKFSFEQSHVHHNVPIATTTDTATVPNEDVTLADTYLNINDGNKSIYDPETIFEVDSSCQLQFKDNEKESDNKPRLCSSQIYLESQHTVSNDNRKQSLQPIGNQRFDIDENTTENTSTISNDPVHHVSSEVSDPRLKRKRVQSEFVELEYVDFKNIIEKIRKMFAKSKEKRLKKQVSDRIRETLMNMVANFNVVHNNSDNLSSIYLTKMAKEVQQLNISLLPTDNVLNILEVFVEYSNPNSLKPHVSDSCKEISYDSICTKPKNQSARKTSYSTSLNLESSTSSSPKQLQSYSTNGRLYPAYCSKPNTVINCQLVCDMPEAYLPKSKQVAALQKNHLDNASDGTLYLDQFQYVSSVTAVKTHTISPCETQLLTVKPKGRLRPKARARARAKARSRFRHGLQLKEVGLPPPPPPPPPLPPCAPPLPLPSQSPYKNLWSSLFY